MLKTDLSFGENENYRCKVAALDIWNHEDQSESQNIKVDLWTFSSEYAIRIQDQVKQLLVKASNHHGQKLLVNKKLTNFWKESGSWKTKNFSTVLEIKENIQVSAQDTINLIAKISKNNTLLGGVLCDNNWYQEIDVSVQGSSGDSASASTAQITQLSKIWKKRKTGSWIWFKDRGDVSTSSDLMCQSPDQNTFSIQEKELQQVGLKSLWGSDNEWGQKIEMFKSWDKQKGGKWVNTEEICGLSNERKWNASEEQFKNLKIFCAKSRD